MKVRGLDLIIGWSSWTSQTWLNQYFCEMVQAGWTLNTRFNNVLQFIKSGPRVKEYRDIIEPSSLIWTTSLVRRIKLKRKWFNLVFEVQLCLAFHWTWSLITQKLYYLVCWFIMYQVNVKNLPQLDSC